MTSFFDIFRKKKKKKKKTLSRRQSLRPFTTAGILLRDKTIINAAAGRDAGLTVNVTPIIED